MASWIGSYLRVAAQLARAADGLVDALSTRRDEVVVNVHGYAFQALDALARRYLSPKQRPVAFFSMNPARNGAVQSGLSFTDAPTARSLFDDFDILVPNRPMITRTERAEMSGQRLNEWIQRKFGDHEAFYAQACAPIVCPVAVLRKPGLTNVPLPNLDPPRRRAADEFYEAWAPRLYDAINPRGVALLGTYAGQRWQRLVQATPRLQKTPFVVTHHPAARMRHEDKYAGWDQAWDALTGASFTETESFPNS